MPLTIGRPPTGNKHSGVSSSEPDITRVELSFRSWCVVLGSVAAVWLLIHMLPVLLVLITALMLVGALSPSVTWLEQRNVRRTFALGTVFGVVVAIAAGLAVVTVPPLIEQLKSLI